MPFLVGGDIFIEVVFNYPGMDLLFFQAALNTGNLLADIGYAALDPRVRYS